MVEGRSALLSKGLNPLMKDNPLCMNHFSKPVFLKPITLTIKFKPGF